MRSRVWGACAALALLASTACGGPAGEPAAGPSSTTPGPTPAIEPLAHGMGEAPVQTEAPTEAPVDTPDRASAPEPTRAPPPPSEPTPPPPPPAPADCEPSYQGENASMAEVRAALTDAAGRTYWPTSAPEIRVPLELVKAVAWQESGWQSAIIACDGGVGVMQVMPDTADFVNQRFGAAYDIDTLAGNALLGANYLAWLIKYFGDVWFDGSYTVDAADCPDHLSPCLLNAVIASYNYGFGAVDLPDGIAIPNPRYVENVRALMIGCECLSY